MKKKSIKFIKEVTNDTIAYGSKETIRRLAVFQNYNFKHSTSRETSDNPDESTFVGMYIVSYVISSLKKDFTGEGINPEDLLKIKLTDYDVNEKFYLLLITKQKNYYFSLD